MKHVLGALLFVASALPAGAQEVRRPKLDSKADTNDWEAYYDFGVANLQRFPVALVKAKRAQDAIDQFNKAIALEPYHAESYVFKARAHEVLQQTDSARLATGPIWCARRATHRTARSPRSGSPRSRAMRHEVRGRNRRWPLKAAETANGDGNVKKR